MKKAQKIILAVSIPIGSLFLAGLVFLLVVIAEAPDLDSVSAEPDGYLTTVLDDDENVMITLAGTEANRVYVTLDMIPEELQEAFIAIEDERFYTHHGIDPKGIARAAMKGLTTGHFSQGASTITQQLVKNNVLTGWTSEETFWDRLCRKIQEQYLALKLERKYSKEWILENYLNTINLGSGTWGVEAAAKKYFGKDVSELTLSECAVLAGITKSPTAYNPITNPDKSEKRTQLVLSAMLDQGYITEEEYNTAMEEDVYAEIEENHTDSSTDVFSYFEDELIESVLADLETAGYSEEDAWNMIYRGGLTIYSTQDSEMQTICEEEINNDDWFSSDAQASIVITDVSTGAVKAIVGGRGEKTASLTYDRATQSLRQPGSTIKIIGEYAAALDTGAATLGTVIDDAPCTYSDGSSISNASGTYKGMTTIRNAIVKSTNTVALKTFQLAGLDNVWTYLGKFGISTLTDADKVEALALGGTSGGVTNLEMTAAYNAIANGGIYQEPYYYTKVLDHEGNVILEKTPAKTQAITSQTAALLTSAMEDVLTEGTGTLAYFSGYPLAGKTGTTNDLKDVWFVGFSPYYTCGVWGGYDDPAAQESGAYVRKLWRAVMLKVHDNYIYKNFPEEDGIVTAEICTKCGKLAIEGLCDATVEGDETCLESFAEGTAPVDYCDCHIRVSICSTSGEPAGSYCPSSCLESSVYLKSATAGTEDEAYVFDEDASVCSVHTSFWDTLFGEDGTFSEFGGGEEPDRKEENSDDSSWYEDFSNGLKQGWNGLTESGW